MCVDDSRRGTPFRPVTNQCLVFFLTLFLGVKNRRPFGIPATLSSPVRESTTATEQFDDDEWPERTNNIDHHHVDTERCGFSSDDSNFTVSLFGQRSRCFRFDEIGSIGHLTCTERHGRLAVRSGRLLTRHPLQAVAGCRFGPAKFTPVL